MTHKSSNTASRKLHSRALLLMSLMVCLFALNTQANGPLQDTVNVQVEVCKYVSVELQKPIPDLNGHYSPLPPIEMGPLSWENGELYVGPEEDKRPATSFPLGVQASARIEVITNTEAKLQVSAKVPLSRGVTQSPSDPSVQITATSPSKTITNGTLSEDWWTYTVQAPGVVSGSERSAILTLTLSLTGWSLATPAGVYSGTLYVSIAAI